MWWATPEGTTITRPPTDPALLETAARSIRIPTLLMRGRHSDLLSEAGARHLLEVLPGARYVDVSGAGHMLAGDRNDAFTDELVSFVGSLQRTA
jgi:pimeloyl-ACP methyl ester carboxylesterase